MGQISNDDSGKVNKQEPAAAPQAEPAAAPAPETKPPEMPDVQLELPCDIVDANGITTTVTAKITITKPVFRMICAVMQAALDSLGVVPIAVDEVPGGKDEPASQPPAQEPA